MPDHYSGDPVRIDVRELEAQARRGHRRLRFAGPLEDAFRQYYCRFMRQHAIAALVAALGLSAVALIINVTLMAPPVPVQQAFVLVFGILLPAGELVSLAYLYRARDARWLPYLSGLMVVGGIGLTLWLKVVYHQHGLTFAYATLHLILIYNFLLIGLRYFQAQGLAWLGAAALFGVEYVVLSSPPAEIATALYNFLAVGALASTAGYLQEFVVRTNFLDSGIRRHQALHDGLTGLLNRHGLDSEGRRVWRQAERDKRSLGVAVFDIDWFKPYNDRFGHPAGDACLARVAEVLRADCTRRPLDIAARLGGEEFAVVWYDVDAPTAVELAERFRAAVEALGIAHPDAPLDKVTLSGGVAVLEPGNTASLDEVLVQADAGLYAAKSAGRNRVVRIRTDGAADLSALADNTCAKRAGMP